MQREAQEQEEREKERERERAEKASRLFGGAKPVDTASREKEIEEKLQREKEEFEKKLAEQARHDRDDRGSSQERQRDGSRDRTRDRYVFMIYLKPTILKFVILNKSNLEMFTGMHIPV